MTGPEYEAALAPGGRLEALALAAALNADRPLPHPDAPPPGWTLTLPGPRRTTPSCPCPVCYQARVDSWKDPQ